CMQYTHIPFTL
nr:immunoglobulin light chain junction region [Macaca mulatta]